MTAAFFISVGAAALSVLFYARALRGDARCLWYGFIAAMFVLLAFFVWPAAVVLS